MHAATILTEWAASCRAMVTRAEYSASSRTWYAAEAARIVTMVERHDVHAMAEILERLARTNDRAALAYEYQFPHDGLRTESAMRAFACRAAAVDLLTQQEAA